MGVFQLLAESNTRTRCFFIELSWLVISFFSGNQLRLDDINSEIIVFINKISEIIISLDWRHCYYKPKKKLSTYLQDMTQIHGVLKMLLKNSIWQKLVGDTYNLLFKKTKITCIIGFIFYAVLEFTVGVAKVDILLSNTYSFRNIEKITEYYKCLTRILLNFWKI